MLRKRRYFVRKVSSRLPRLEWLYGKIFFPFTEISVTGPGRLLIWTYWSFTKERVASQISETKPARFTGLVWSVSTTKQVKVDRPICFDFNDEFYLILPTRYEDNFNLLVPFLFTIIYRLYLSNYNFLLQLKTKTKLLKSNHRVIILLILKHPSSTHGWHLFRDAPSKRSLSVDKTHFNV